MMVVQAGYSVAFLILAGVAAAAFTILLFAMPQTCPELANQVRARQLSFGVPAQLPRRCGSSVQAIVE